MEIFISHSSRDKWAARRISEDLQKLGATTFLDEKDIRTGHSIDDSIRKGLKTCDNFLLLISPSSLKSDWVLVELGGALALEKQIVPILLYVGANEIPSMINLKLARDINDIDRFYSEVEARIKGKKVPLKRKPKKDLPFKLGDKVKITNTVPKDIYLEDGFLVDWEEEMNQFLGKTSVINHDFGDGSYGLELDNFLPEGGKLYAKEWLSLE